MRGQLPRFLARHLVMGSSVADIAYELRDRTGEYISDDTVRKMLNELREDGQ